MKWKTDPGGHDSSFLLEIHSFRKEKEVEYMFEYVVCSALFGTTLLTNTLVRGLVFIHNCYNRSTGTSILPHTDIHRHLCL